ncbi:hypothetical protein K438DRAFT_2010097 [Mycena galopus ATCC 62051]|nr:hypothetical protein K438DRAFT_2010097 [Mycena galopus ATCC 62051]
MPTTRREKSPDKRLRFLPIAAAFQRSTMDELTPLRSAPKKIALKNLPVSEAAYSSLPQEQTSEEATATGTHGLADPDDPYLLPIGDVSDSLRTQYDSMVAETFLEAILKSHGSRQTLLQLAESVGIGEEATLRSALREDEERFAKYILGVLDSESERKAVLRLDGDSAQCFLDITQNTLDGGFLLRREYDSKARRLIVKLSEACDKIPSALFITGVVEHHSFLSFHGGFGCIYQASYAGATVALKHMRTFANGGEDQRRIRLHPDTPHFIGIDREAFPPSLCMVSPWVVHGTVLKYLNVVK